MKNKIRKIFVLGFSMMVLLSMLLIQPALAVEKPVFDADFDGGKGAFFANGTPIVIRKAEDKTWVNWVGGSQEVPATVKIFGGGTAGTKIASASVEMEGGTVAGLYGGGCSTDPQKPAVVSKSRVTVNGGTVTGSAYAGGLLYSRASDATITVNGGNITFLVGGGAASATINNIAYQTGTETAPQDSGTVVETSTVIVNDGAPTYVFGGGQGYSYTANTSVLMQGGEVQYLTAGGSNGLTGTAEVTVSGGTVEVYQSVNRGTLNKINLLVKGGQVNTLYLGSEDADDATGTVKGAEVNLISGFVNTLTPGKNANTPLVIIKPQFKIAFAESAVGVKNVPPGDVTSIAVQLEFIENPVEVLLGNATAVPVSITTTPAGYEQLFRDLPLVWNSTDETVLSVQNGVVTGLQEGTALLTATLNGTSAVDAVTVLPAPIWPAILAFLLVFLVTIFLAFALV